MPIASFGPAAFSAVAAEIERIERWKAMNEDRLQEIDRLAEKGRHFLWCRLGRHGKLDEKTQMEVALGEAAERITDLERGAP